MRRRKPAARRSGSYVLALLMIVGCGDFPEGIPVVLVEDAADNTVDAHDAGGASDSVDAPTDSLAGPQDTVVDAAEDAPAPDAEEGCQTHEQCDDGDPCTADSCTIDGTCVYTAATGPCDDGDPCTEGETCSEGACSGGTAVCECESTSDCAAFENGDACDGTLACDTSVTPAVCQVDPSTVVVCDGAGQTACKTSQCIPETGLCVDTAAPDGSECDDGDPCTAAAACQSGACKPTSGVCDDPPQPVCADADTLTVYATEGTCEEGGCAYDSVLEPCEKGCSGGVCAGALTLLGAGLTPTQVVSMSGGEHQLIGTLSAFEGTAMSGGGYTLTVGGAP